MIMKECTWCDADLIQLLDDIKLAALFVKTGSGDQGCIRGAEQKPGAAHTPVEKKNGNKSSS